MPDQPPKSATIKLDGDNVAKMIKAAGLDPHKLDLKKALPGAHVDYQELESRLMGTLAPSKGHWHVVVGVTHDD